MVVHGRVMWAWAELDSQAEPDSRAGLDSQTELDSRAGLDSQAALVLAGRALPGRTEIVQVLQLVAGGNAEEWW